MTWWNSSNPDKVKPSVWMHPAAVLYLDELVRPHMTVIEHGCGGSTLWLAQRVERVYSFDNNDEWRMAVQRLVPSNTTVSRYDEDTWELLEDINADLLLVDGYIHDRPDWILNADKIVKPGGIVVIDNAERKPYSAARHELQKKCVRPMVVTAYAPKLLPHGVDKLVTTEFLRLKGGETWI